MSKSVSFWEHPIETLEKALHIRKQIDQLNEMLKDLFGSNPPSLGATPTNVERRGRKGKRKMSAEAKAKIAAAQRARWAKQKGIIVAEEFREAAPAAVQKKRRGMSAAGRARIAAAQRARWAKVKGQTSPLAGAKAGPRKKRKISAAHRAKLAASAKARWARVKMGKQ